MKLSSLITDTIEDKKGDFHTSLNELNEKIKEQEKKLEEQQRFLTLCKFSYNAIKQQQMIEIGTASKEPRFLATPKVLNTTIHKIVFFKDLKKSIEEASNLNDSKGAIIQRLDAPFKQIEYLKE